MNVCIAGVLAVSAALIAAAAIDYSVTIVKQDPLSDISLMELLASENLVGMSIEDIFGPIYEVRVELMGLNSTEIDNDEVMLEQRIRERIDGVECLGRTSEIPWHMAPWINGYLLMEDGRILPIQILLSGIVIADMLFAEVAEPVTATD